MHRSENDGLEPVQKTDAPLNLSGLDLQTWLEVLSALPVARVTESDILAWVEGPLRKFFPFEKFVGAYGGLSGGMIRMRSLVTSGYPQEFLSTLEGVFDLTSRGCFSWWASKRKPFFLDKTGARDEQDVQIFAS